MGSKAVDLPVKNVEVKPNVKPIEQAVKTDAPKTSPNVNGLKKDLGADVNRYPTGKKESTSMTNSLLDEKKLYETETHAQRNYSADLRISTDKAGEISELLNKANWDTEDIAVASKLIPQIDNLDEKMQMIKKVG